MRLRFTIRDLLWLLLVVALGLGWWLDRDTIRQGRSKLQNLQAEQQKVIQRHMEAVKKLEDRMERLAEEHLRLRGDQSNLGANR